MIVGTGLFRNRKRAATRHRGPSDYWVRHRVSYSTFCSFAEGGSHGVIRFGVAPSSSTRGRPCHHEVSIGHEGLLFEPEHLHPIFPAKIPAHGHVHILESVGYPDLVSR